MMRMLPTENNMDSRSERASENRRKLHTQRSSSDEALRARQGCRSLSEEETIHTGILS
jgi:hypothetical protein